MQKRMDFQPYVLNATYRHPTSGRGMKLINLRKPMTGSGVWTNFVKRNYGLVAKRMKQGRNRKGGSLLRGIEAAYRSKLTPEQHRAGLRKRNPLPYGPYNWVGELPGWKWTVGVGYRADPGPKPGPGYSLSNGEWML